MLKLSDSFSSTIIQYLVIARASKSNEKTRTLHDFGTKVRIAVAVALVDSFIVGGIAFFSSMMALGYVDILMNIKISFFSSAVMGGMTFFNELKKQVSTARKEFK